MTPVTEPTNEDRANRIPPTLKAYCEVHGDALQEDAYLPDLLADLMHYAKREGYDFQTLLTVAEVNFNCEDES